jgi:hypothetical protein
MKRLKKFFIGFDYKSLVIPAVIVVLSIMAGVFFGKGSPYSIPDKLREPDTIRIEITVKPDSTVEENERKQELPDLTTENFISVCESLSIQHPNVVYAQSVLESGNFTSNQFKTKNNFLGLYDSKNKRYMSFSHWTECLLAYRDKVQYRYRGSSHDTEEYLCWLENIGYAEDPDYVRKVRKLIK